MEQNRLLTDGKYITIGAILTALVLFNLWNQTSVLLSAIIFGFYLIFFGQNLGQAFMPDEKKFWQKIFGILALLGLQTIVLSIIYWFYRVDRQIIAVIIVFLPIAISFLKIKYANPLTDLATDFAWDEYAETKSYLWTKLMAIFVIAGQALMLYTLWTKRFSDTLVSPWTIIGLRFFIVFVITTICLLWVLQKSKHSASNLLMIILHTALILNVALIIFKIGFGFDPFIHRAAEKWILEHGSIEPKTPYYLGQYVLAILTHLTTKIPLATIDKILVPLGASILIPLLTYFSLSRAGFKNKLYPALALIPLLPLNYFTVTTPNNLALLVAYFVFLLIWREKMSGRNHTFWLGLVLCLAATAIHPFVGLPVIVIYLASHLFSDGNKIKDTIFSIAYPIILALTLPTAFYINSLRGEGGFALANPLSRLANFLAIFTKPHWVWLERGDLWWQALYIYRGMIKPIFFVVAILGLITIIKKIQKPIEHGSNEFNESRRIRSNSFDPFNPCSINLPKFIILSAIGLFVSAFVLSTSIKFTDVITYEQNVYAERVLELMLVLLIPSFVLCLRELFIKIKKNCPKQLLTAIILAVLLLISWYFTYPTRDKVAFHTGWSVRQADVDAVNFINNLNQNKKDYVVIANQLLGAAALQEFGFEKYFKTATGEHYFYSIPTGGPFYQYFRKMVYQKPQRQWMKEAMTVAGVNKAYFVHTNYWAPAAEIRDKAKLEADRWWELDGGRVWIYEFVKK